MYIWIDRSIFLCIYRYIIPVISSKAPPRDDLRDLAQLRGLAAALAALAPWDDPLIYRTIVHRGYIHMYICIIYP